MVIRCAFSPKSLPCNHLRIPFALVLPAPIHFVVPIAPAWLSGPANAQQNARHSRFNDITNTWRRDSEGKLLQRNGVASAWPTVPESSVYDLGTYMTAPTEIDHPIAEPAPDAAVRALGCPYRGKRKANRLLWRPGFPSAS